MFLHTRMLARRQGNSGGPAFQIDCSLDITKTNSQCIALKKQKELMAQNGGVASSPAPVINWDGSTSPGQNWDGSSNGN
jgi:hypothetical protein